MKQHSIFIQFIKIYQVKINPSKVVSQSIAYKNSILQTFLTNHRTNLDKESFYIR